jgi:hypothetical protein
MFDDKSMRVIRNAGPRSVMDSMAGGGWPHACEQTRRLGRTVSEALNNLYALSYVHVEEKDPGLSMEQAHAALRNAVRALRDHITEHRCA